MREQFEAWITKGMSEMHKGIMLRRLECSDGYFHTVTSASWEAWQASRAAIEIHLPGEFRESHQSSNMVMDAEAVKERLADAGINFKE